MARKIQHKRGLKDKLPALSEAELGWCSDTEELYIGRAGGRNLRVNKERGENLLVNWYFPDPINQRGAASYGGTANVYTIDRWRVTNANTTVTVADDGITLTGATGSAPYFQQLLENYNLLLGKTLTLSALMKDGTLYSATSTLPTALPTSNTLYCNKANFFDVLATSSALSVRLKAASGGTNGFVAAKLEFGAVQTLARQNADGTWVLNDSMPNKAIELLKCCMSTADSADTYANNKKLAEVMGALSTSGGTLTDNLKIQKVSGPNVRLRETTNGSAAVMQQGANQFAVYNQNVDGSNVDYRAFVLNNSAAAAGVDKALRLIDKTAAGAVWYSVLHTGNMTGLGFALADEVAYTGTGTGGSSAPTNLVFDIAPDILILFGADGFPDKIALGLGSVNDDRYLLHTSVLSTEWTQTARAKVDGYDDDDEYYSYYEEMWVKKSTDGKTISFYSRKVDGSVTTAIPLYNTSGTKYRWVGLKVT